MLKSSHKELDLGVLPLKREGDKILLLDQRYLPEKVEFFDATSLERMCFAIKDMVVRGAPSIGVAAAYGLAAEAERLSTECGGDTTEFLNRLAEAKAKLYETRPTAVNLRWALDHVFDRAKDEIERKNGLKAVSNGLLAYADEIFADHIERNRQLSAHGQELVPVDAAIITHCNAGPLAACGWGSALGVIRSANEKGKNPMVFVDETRPRNQGARLTMWELHQDKIPCTLICDSMSGHVMKTKKVDLVVVGADRIAANGDTANKIGTYNLAVLANFHKIPFYIAAPLSTIDPTIASGDLIPIEERDPNEILSSAHTVAGAAAYNPAFDVTPCDLIAGIITECGVLRAPYTDSIARALDAMPFT